jgi:hypothetical protein
MAHSKSIVDHFSVVLLTILRRSLNDSAVTIEEPLVEDTEEDPEDDLGRIPTLSLNWRAADPKPYGCDCS